MKEELEFRKLPALTEAACAIISVGGGTFFLIFGGHDGENPTADLIAVDVEALIWWFVDVQGTQIRPRMTASMVAIENKIFIFGGRDEFDDKTPAIRTYSIAKYDPQTRWTWTVSDMPLPPDLPLLCSGLQAIPVYNGQKILLTQGRIQNDAVSTLAQLFRGSAMTVVQPIDMTRESTIFFHTHNLTFQDARATMGNFPGGIFWYLLDSFVAGARAPAPIPPRRRGSPRKNPLPADMPEAPVNPAMPAHTFPPSVIIFAWVQQDDEHLVPEAWQYFLPPTERIRCLNLKDMLWDLDLDFRASVAVGNRLLLLGHEEGDGPVLQWNVAIEISSHYLAEN